MWVFFCKILIFPMIFFKSVSILVLSFSDIIINILKKFVRKRKMFLWNFKVVYCIFKIMSFWWTEFSINLDCIVLITLIRSWTDTFSLNLTITFLFEVMEGLPSTFCDLLVYLTCLKVLDRDNVRLFKTFFVITSCLRTF